MRKRKSNTRVIASTTMPDLNLLLEDNIALVLTGLVSVRVHQYDGGSEYNRAPIDEQSKKQKRSDTTQHARSAVAAGGNPRQAR